jgi:phage host-nuclease inhibitor protein Gam
MIREDLIPEIPGSALQVVDDIPTGLVELDAWLEWRLQKLASIRAEMERNQAVAQGEHDRITSWLDEQNATLQRNAEWLQDQIHQASLAYDFGSKKSRKLPSGTFGFEQRGGSVKITDMAAAVRWAKEHGFADSVKETIGVTPIKQYIESTGETPAFVTVEPKVDHFYVKVGS